MKGLFPDSGGVPLRSLFAPRRHTKTQKPPNPQIRGFKRQAAAVSFATTSAVVRWSRSAQLSPVGTCRAAIAASTRRQAPWAGNPMTASRTRAHAPQVLQVASE
jgi:hypothetical protein